MLKFSPFNLRCRYLQMVDNPPAYTDVDGHGRHYAAMQSISNPSLLPHPPPSVDQVHVFERRHNIHGTFYIDPLIPAVSKGKHKSKRPLPHASFRTRNNAIQLDLGTTGDIRKSPKANVSVSNKSGNIKITILPVLPSKPRLSLDVSSRHGNIILFLPQGFSGVVQLTTRKGEMNILPALRAIIKTVKASQRETIFMIGAQPTANDSDNSHEASFCELSSRTGNITVGLSGLDLYVPRVGFWQKIGGYLGVGDKAS